MRDYQSKLVPECSLEEKIYHPGSHECLFNGKNLILSTKFVYSEGGGAKSEHLILIILEPVHYHLAR